MGTVAVREELLARVAEIARARHLPLEAQVEEFLREAVDRRNALAGARRRLEEVAAMTPRGVTQTDSVDLLREDRER